MAEIRLVPQAAQDYLASDNAVRIDVRKAFAKIEVDPRAYGEPIGNKAGVDLFGFFSIRAGRRIRVIYSIDDDGLVVVRVIGKRDAFIAHKTARERIDKLATLTRDELIDLRRVLGEDGQAL